MLADTSVFQLRDTRVEILGFLEKFLDKVSPTLKGWEKTYATDIRVSIHFHYLFIYFTCLYCVLHGKDRAVTGESTGIITSALFLVQICFHMCKCFVNSVPFKDTCIVVYTKDKVAKSRTPVLELLIKVGF